MIGELWLNLVTTAALAMVTQSLLPMVLFAWASGAVLKLFT
ncbi:MAG: hypothetical protein QMD04_12310 [Anaerolineales bacterium]|nr:hypothetical protein [Anaerolineales bacterium]